MGQQILNIILTALGAGLTALVSWGTALLIQWLNGKIKDQKIARWTTAITTIISGAVQSVFQSYVETLKKEGIFTKEAQIKAKDEALRIVVEQLTPELRKYIEDNFGDMMEWLSQQIEAMIYKLKK